MDLNIRSAKVIASPYRLLFIIVATVFVAEVIIMVALRGLQLAPQYEILIDASVLIIITFPALYWLLHRPLNIAAEKHRQLTSDLEISNNMLTTVLDSLDALIYVADIDTHEVLLVNKYGRDLFGEVTGKPCWEAFQKEQHGECTFCSNEILLDDQGQPTGLHKWEHQNTKTKRWYVNRNRAIQWIDGRMVRLEIATDFTSRKMAEEERESLIFKLEQALAEVKTLSGLLPICMHCKKVRDDQGFWAEVETYISTRSEAKFSHGICPGCLKEHFPEQADKILKQTSH